MHRYTSALTIFVTIFSFQLAYAQEPFAGNPFADDSAPAEKPPAPESTAQPPVAIAPRNLSKWEPASLPSFALEFEKIAIAKSTSPNSVSVIYPVYRSETRTRVISVPKYSTASKTREVMVDGRMVQQTYDVMLPYIEEVEQTYTVRYLSSKERIEVPHNQVLCWNREGQKLTSQQIKDAFSTTRHIYLLDSPQPPVMDAYYASVLSKDLLFVFKPTPEPSPFDEPAFDSERAKMLEASIGRGTGTANFSPMIGD